MLLLTFLLATASAAGIPAVVAPIAARQQVPDLSNIPGLAGIFGSGDQANLDGAMAWASAAEQMYSDPRYLSLESVILAPGFTTYNVNQLQSVNSEFFSVANQYFSGNPYWASRSNWGLAQLTNTALMAGGTNVDDNRSETITKAPAETTSAESTEATSAAESSDTNDDSDSASGTAASAVSKASAAASGAASKASAAVSGVASAGSAAGSAAESAGSAAGSAVSSAASAAGSAAESAASAAGSGLSSLGGAIASAGGSAASAAGSALGSATAAVGSATGASTPNSGVSNGVSLVGAAFMVVAALI